MNISGKNVIITGGTGGIGAAVCRELLRSGILVYLNLKFFLFSITSTINFTITIEYWNFGHC